ncbi:hypothetical protein RC1_0228 [Rhodospirillum centenum SW]|uniref:Uncharacterized protein n=1 Tax=Rhodospirillum centenum (strain ATCC 51521 / SW) TaxID=414684 RepID=B6IQE1_RHOCS|nr:hypothetical protein RC1_0228 [Rhodospirillum centenum SW]
MQGDPVFLVLLPAAVPTAVRTPAGRRDIFTAHRETQSL